MRIYNRNWYIIVGAALLAVSAGPLYAQSAINPVRPNALGTDVVPLDRVPLIQVPEVDRELAAWEDEANEAQGLPPRFAIPEPVQITPATHGIWENLPDGRHLWRLRIHSPGATSLNLGFTRYVMPDGGQLLVHSADTGYVIRPFTAADNEEHNQLWTPIVPSDEIVVEVTLLPRNVADLDLELTFINVGYRGFGAGSNSDGGPRVGSCNVDVICPEGDAWRDDITAIAVISTGGSTFCTGFMVNNAEQDLTPFFMTANHCGIGAGNAPSLVAYWNYENSFCRPPGSPQSGQPGDGLLTMFNTGSIFRAGYSPSDFTLVELDDDPNPDFNVGFAGWDNSGADASSAVAIHHPDTLEKRISFENQPTTTTSYLQEAVPGDGTHVRVEDWDLGTTEPGSSGSPLFDQDHRIIGQLHGGFASCTSQTSDWYGKFSVSWIGGGSSSTRLSDWLDPLGTGVTAVDTISGLGLQVTPANDVIHFGEVGGPFTDDTVLYTLTNYGPNSLDYSVDLNTFFGILLDGGTAPVAGTLAGGGGTVEVTLTLGPDVY
ncbi:MAG: trypsin-like peptidase domain-containing protein, partial [Planctomycetes bacterium]|nr:trypsin-like peptidase domain-containing protein [Planctomycetota bacterium]